MNKLEEYDMGIQTTKLVRGLGLAKPMAGRNLQNIKVNEVKEGRVEVFQTLMNSEWYKDVIFYLRHLSFPEH